MWKEVKKKQGSSYAILIYVHGGKQLDDKHSGSSFENLCPKSTRINSFY